MIAGIVVKKNGIKENIIDRTTLENTIKQESLIETDDSLAGITNLDKQTSLYFGVGLCNGGKTPELSKGVPIDLMIMVFVGELLAKKGFVDSKTILIADTHAKGNGFSDDQVTEAAERYKSTITKALGNMGFKWSVVKASEIDRTDAYNLILGLLKEDNDYVKRELADMEWFNKEKNVGLKLGWAAKNGTRRTDEVSFDKMFEEKFGKKMSFIYTACGKTMDPIRPRIAPYFCNNSDARILLAPGEDVENKFVHGEKLFGKQGVNCYTQLIKGIIRLNEQINGKIDTTGIERSQQAFYKLQKIVDMCVR